MATSASARAGLVGMGGCMIDTQANGNNNTMPYYSITIGKRTEQNPYTAELGAIAAALERTPVGTCRRWITILSSNRSALAAISQPRQQSGQKIIQRIYKLVQTLQCQGNAINAIWVPAHTDMNVKLIAKIEAQKSTRIERQPEAQLYQGKSTALRLAIAE